MPRPPYDQPGDGSARTKRGPARTFPRGRVVQMLAEGVSQSKIAEVYGISQPAVSVFARKPEVAKEIAEIRAGALDAAKSRMAGMTNRALDLLSEVIDDTMEKPMVRLRAAAILLDHVLDTPKDDRDGRVDGPLTDEDMGLVRRFMAERDAERVEAPTV